MKKSTALSLALVAATAPMIALAPTASADGMGHHGELKAHANLDPVPTNRVHGHGWARVSLQGDKATVSLKIRGLLENAPHAQHIHIAAKGVCPPASAATRHRGHLAISTVDGQPFYGRIGASLTTTGDTSPDSALAVNRFPSKGSYFYSRTIKVGPTTARSIRQGTAVIVVHGIDYNNNGRYDFKALGKSSLDPSLPLEATAPALCGALKKGPGGPVHGGVGGTQGTDGIALSAAAGGAALLAAGGVLYMRRRRSAEG